MQKRVLYIDLETYSTHDINYGSYHFTESEEFEILLIAYAFDNEPVHLIDLTARQKPDEAFIEALSDPEILKISHNANFERICLSHFLNLEDLLPSQQWFCSLSYAAYCGIPSSLEKAGQYLEIPHQKMEEGKNGILFFSKPGKNGRNYPGDDYGAWFTFKRYCMRDVEAMREICQAMAQIAPFPEKEKQIYDLDQKINDRGIQIDQELIDKIERVQKRYEKSIFENLYGRNLQINLRSNRRIHEFLKTKNLYLSSLSEENINALLAENKDQEVEWVLQGRLNLSKPASKKFQGFTKMKLKKDQALHGLLRYYGNHHGEWELRALSPSIFEPGTYQNIEQLRSLVLQENLEMLNEIYHVPAALISLLPAAFRARKDHLLAMITLPGLLEKMERAILLSIYRNLVPGFSKLNLSQKRKDEVYDFIDDSLDRVLFDGESIRLCEWISLSCREYRGKKVLEARFPERSLYFYDAWFEDGFFSFIARPKQGRNEFAQQEAEDFVHELALAFQRDLISTLMLELDRADFHIVLYFNQQITLEIPADKLDSSIKKLKDLIDHFQFLSISPDYKISISPYHFLAD